MFSNAKVGERVCSYTYGWGEISAINTESVELTTKSGLIISETIDGRLSEDAVNQDLFYGEIKVEIPESAKKPKVEWKFPCYGVGKYGEIIVYFKSMGYGIIVKNGEIGYEHNNFDMSKFMPCTLEPKDL